jgi:Ca2+-binding RTX toxin-like protein
MTCLYGDNGNDSLAGGDGRDTLYGNAGNDTLSGDAGNDSLVGYIGNDRLSGGNDNDTLIGGSGNDTLDGGSGSMDIASYSDSTEAVIVNLATGRAVNDGFDTADTLTGIEGVWGSAFHDSLTGNSGKNYLAGHNGNDTLSGGAGNDTLTGGTGNDSLLGEAGNDILKGGEGRDTINGGAGNDRIIVWGTFAVGYYSGADAAGDALSPGNVTSHAVAGEIIDGGAGIDILEIYGAVDLSTATISNIEALDVHSDLTLDADILALTPISAINGDGTSILRIVGTGMTDLTEVAISNFATLDVGAGVEMYLSAAGYAQFGCVTGAGEVYVDGNKIHEGMLGTSV